jgi:hypothetical protein
MNITVDSPIGNIVNTKDDTTLNYSNKEGDNERTENISRLQNGEEENQTATKQIENDENKNTSNGAAHPILPESTFEKSSTLSFFTKTIAQVRESKNLMMETLKSTTSPIKSSATQGVLSKSKIFLKGTLDSFESSLKSKRV